MLAGPCATAAAGAAGAAPAVAAGAGAGAAGAGAAAVGAGAGGGAAGAAPTGAGGGSGGGTMSGASAGTPGAGALAVCARAGTAAAASRHARMTRLIGFFPVARRRFASTTQAPWDCARKRRDTASGAARYARGSAHGKRCRDTRPCRCGTGEEGRSWQVRDRRSVLGGAAGGGGRPEAAHIVLLGPIAGRHQAAHALREGLDDAEERHLINARPDACLIAPDCPAS